MTLCSSIVNKLKTCQVGSLSMHDNQKERKKPKDKFELRLKSKHRIPSRIALVVVVESESGLCTSSKIPNKQPYQQINKFPK